MLTTTLLTLVTPILVAAQPARAQLPDSLDLTAVRRIAVQHDGRWPPLDTVARDWARSVTGRESYQGRDPLLLLLACSFQPDIWQQVPLIRIANAELRRELQLSPFKTEFSYAELVGHRPLHLLIDGLSQIEPGRKPNPLESKVSDINGELIQLQQAFMGQTIKPIPDPKNPLGAWRPIAAGVQSTAPQTEAVKTAWIALGNAFRADDAAAFEKASTDFATALNSLPAAHRPAAALVNTELRYNRLRPFRTAWIISGVGALLAGVAMFVRRKSLDVIATITMVAGFGVLTYGLSLRWQIAGRIPASNMFESLLFLSWGMGAFAIIAMLVQRQRLVPLTASGMGALSLFLADSLPLDHFIRPIAPVLLDTVWMSIHVPIIMVSYSVLALAVLVAHVQVGVMAVAPGREKLIRSIDGLHYWYAHVGAILLFVGIVTGSMWAASSWGRYWGWDPKEVWSLVAFLGYMAILHVRASHEQVPRWALGVGALLLVVVFAVVVPKLAPLTGGKVLALSASAVAVVFFVVAKGRLAIAVKSILAFWMIIMTYVGVNYVLGIGLHSYGFGTGAVASRMFTLGGIDLALVGLGSAICLIRQRASIPRDVKLPLIGSMPAHAAHR